MENIFQFIYFKDKKKIYTIIIALYTILTILLIFLNSLSERFATHNKHVTHSVINIKYLSTQSHLWLEEYLNGDIKERPKINKYLKQALDEIDILLFGGSIRGFAYKPTHNDSHIINSLKKSKEILNEIESLTHLRVKKSSQKQHLDDAFDINFEYLIKQLNKLDNYIATKFKKMFTIYEYVKHTIHGLFILLLFFGITLTLLLKKDARDNLNISYIDELTQIQNRKAYLKEIAQQLSLFDRYQTPFSMMMFDIDDFKKINDTYGHNVGDNVLVDISKLVSSHLRSSDLIFRIGGEEFMVLLSATRIDDAAIVAQKIRSSVEYGLKTIENKKITISIGLTEVLKDDTIECIYKRVDELLYKAKNSGKNMVVQSDAYLSSPHYIKVVLDKKANIVEFECTLRDTDISSADVIGKNWFDTFIEINDKKEVEKVFKALFNEKEKEWKTFRNDIVYEGLHHKFIDFHNEIIFKDDEKLIYSFGVEHIDYHLN